METLKEYRVCPECKKKLILNNVNFNTSNLQYFNGFSFRCKLCASKRDKVRSLQRKEYFSNYQKQWIGDNKEKHLARLLVAKLVKSGILKRLPCEVCGNIKSHGHHDDYDKPTEVRWLCSKHHRIYHESLKLLVKTP